MRPRQKLGGILVPEARPRGPYPTSTTAPMRSMQAWR